MVRSDVVLPCSLMAAMYDPCATGLFLLSMSYILDSWPQTAGTLSCSVVSHRPHVLSQASIAEPSHTHGTFAPLCHEGSNRLSSRLFKGPPSPSVTGLGPAAALV